MEEELGTKYCKHLMGRRQHGGLAPPNRSCSGMLESELPHNGAFWGFWRAREVILVELTTVQDCSFITLPRGFCCKRAATRLKRACLARELGDLRQGVRPGSQESRHNARASRAWALFTARTPMCCCTHACGCRPKVCLARSQLPDADARL